MQKGAAATGSEDVRRTLETIKPKQAKELLVLMLEQKEMDDVVVLMAGMPDGKRAKIIAEFKTPAEVEQTRRGAAPHPPGRARRRRWPRTPRSNSNHPRGRDRSVDQC